MTSIEQRCIEQGLKMTEQRRIIAAVLSRMSKANKHPDVEEIYAEASKKDERISLATVYRTLRLLEEAGIIARHEFSPPVNQDNRTLKARYEEATEEHHDHLIDLRTGKVIEFVNEEIEKLQEKVARELGYRLVDHRLELYALPLKDKEES